MQLRCKRKIYKEKYRMFARDSQMLRNKCHFVISMIAINVFHCMTQGLVLYDFSRRTGPLSRLLRHVWGSLLIGIPTGKYQMKKAQSFEEPLNQFTPFDRLIKVSHIFNDSQFVDRGIFTALCHINTFSWI